jgi:hypothetical protein
VEVLEHEPDRGGPQRRHLPVGQRRHVVPSMRTVPEDGRSNVPIRCSMVDLPDPDGPTIPTSSPRATRSDTSRSATTSPGYTRLTSVSSTTAVMRAPPP